MHRSALVAVVAVFGIASTACEERPQIKVGVTSVEFQRNGCVAYLWANDSNPLFSAEATKARIEEQIQLEPSKSQVNTALMAAVARDDQAAVETLLSSDANVNESNNRGCTALTWAAALKRSDIARMLLNSGSRVDQPDATGRTPLIFAVKSGDPETVRILLDAGADVNHQQTGGINEVGRAPLHSALTRTDNVQIIRMLVDAGADTTIQDSLGKSPLDEARAWKRQNAVEYLESLAD